MNSSSSNPNNTSIKQTDNTDFLNYPLVFAKSGVYVQTDKGIYKEEDDSTLLTPYNIDCDLKGNSLIICVTKMPEEGETEFTKRFLSDVDKWDKLPDAVIHACSYVEQFDRRYVYLLKDIILSDVGCILYHEELVDIARCFEMTHALYTLHDNREFAKHIQFARANPEYHIPGTPI